MHLLFSLVHTGAIIQHREVVAVLYLLKVVQDKKNMLTRMLTMEMMT